MFLYDKDSEQILARHWFCVMRRFPRGNVTHLFDLEDAQRPLSSTGVTVYAQHVFLLSRQCARLFACLNGSRDTSMMRTEGVTPLSITQDELDVRVLVSITGLYCTRHDHVRSPEYFQMLFG